MRVLHNNLIRFLLIVIALVAISSPFWLFQSVEKMDENSDSQALHGTLTVSSSLNPAATTTQDKIAATKPNSIPQSTQANSKQTTGIIDLNHLPNVLATPQAAASTAKSATQPQAKRNELDDHSQAPSHDQHNICELLTDKSPIDTQADDNAGTTQADSAANKPSPIAEGDKADLAKNDKDAPTLAKGDTTDLAKSDKADSAENDKDAQTSAQGKSLQQQVDDIIKKQGPMELAKYKQAQNERRDQVTWAVNTIAENSKIYLPEYLSSRAVIVYFGVEIKAQAKGKSKAKIDGLSGPTKLALPPKEIYTEHGKEYKARYKFGNGVHYIANMLHEESGAELYNISTVERYPTNEGELYDYAFKQQVDNYRPELTDDQALDFNKFDTIYLCYPIWWQDMPMPLYSFLDKYDLSGKTLIPICLSRKEGFYRTVDNIAMAEPNASIRNKWLIRPKDIESIAFRTTLRNWLMQLNSDLN